MSKQCVKHLQSVLELHKNMKEVLRKHDAWINENKKYSRLDKLKYIARKKKEADEWFQDRVKEL